MATLRFADGQMSARHLTPGKIKFLQLLKSRFCDIIITARPHIDSQSTKDDDEGKNVAGRDEGEGVTTLKMHLGESSSLRDFLDVGLPSPWCTTRSHYSFNTLQWYLSEELTTHCTLTSSVPICPMFVKSRFPLIFQYTSYSHPHLANNLLRSSRPEEERVQGPQRIHAQEAKWKRPDHSEIASTLSMEHTENAMWM
ncbi:hypothetical protein BU15DRAFT_82531 [Melanogaster broomeanus]|nr:hypothetical protein BU15DRAFT_82531 [Melanogaster broomeanus]